MTALPERAPGTPPPLPQREAVIGEEISGVRELPQKPEATPAEVGEADIIESASLDDELKALTIELPPAEKGYVGKLFERLKSAEVVKNIADRYAVWSDSRHAERIQKNIGKLDAARAAAEKTRHALLEQGKGSAKEVESVASALKELGIELGEEELGRVKEEAGTFADKASAVEGQIEGIEGRKQDLATKKEGFESLVASARDRLDGRLAAKQEVNNQSLETFRGEVADFDSQIKTNRDQITELTGKAEKVRVMMGAVKLGTFKDILGGQLALIESKLKKLDKPTKKLEADRKKVEGKIAEVEKNNSDLEARRERIFPKKEKTEAATTEAGAAKPVAIDNRMGAEGATVLEFSDGTRKELTTNGVVVFGAEGVEKLEPLDELSDDDFAEFFSEGWDAEELERAGTAPAIIERVERVREARAQNAGEIISGWNGFARRELGNKSGLGLAVEGDPGRRFASRDAAREYLKTLLAKKVAKGNVGMLSHRAVGLIERFFDSRGHK